MSWELAPSRIIAVQIKAICLSRPKIGCMLEAVLNFDDEPTSGLREGKLSVIKIPG
jgi:hypothetical protein